MQGTGTSESAIEGRFLIDGSMARGGGGYTYLVNIVPLLSRMAPRARFPTSRSIACPTSASWRGSAT